MRRTLAGGPSPQHAIISRYGFPSKRITASDEVRGDSPRDADPSYGRELRAVCSRGAALKIVAVLLTEGVAMGERGLDIRGLMTNLCAPLPLRVDFLHATVILDLNPQDSGPVFPIEIELRDPDNDIIAESRTRTSFALGVQGSPSVVTFPIGTVFLDAHGPYIVNVRVGSTSGSVAFDFHG